ncbi:IS66 family transposase [Thalassoroseus pseudoceratinae]|uniref:IS66 family transposase n=1 Tax=Thalassoroseus pseudoceratinae TaxID=2713176 RepID=UPI0021BC7D6D|nr:IS66 family transposase [Thalassoroseus pseudoceratinae]
MRMLDRQAKGGSRLARFWTYIGDDSNPYSVYDFTESRRRDGPASFLADYQGTMHADAYGGYDGIVTGSNGAIVRVACGAHIRRKFEQARSQSPRASAQMLEWFGQLYDIEDRVRETSIAERQAVRQRESQPILESMKSALDEWALRELPKSNLGQAVSYARNQWSAFRLYTEDGRRTIDNNLSERTLRSQAIGRRNWLFLGYKSAGPRAAVLFTILAGANRHHLEP